MNFQMQSQLNKQLVEQKMDLEYNIDNLGKVLSKCEIYILRFGDPNKIKNFKQIFGFYNRFNTANEIDQINLYKGIVNGVKFLESGFEETKSKFGEILFPSNMSKSQIIEYIKKLMFCLVYEREKSIFIDLIDVIEEKKVNFNKYKEFFDSNAKMDPKKVMEAYPHINKAIETKEMNWRNNIESNQNYFPGLILNQNFKDDKAFKGYISYKENTGSVC